MTDTHGGGCACRTVRYRVHGQPVLGSVCHCRFCQTRLASAFAVMASFKEEAVTLLHGDLSTSVEAALGRDSRRRGQLRTGLCRRAAMSA